MRQPSAWEANYPEMLRKYRFDPQRLSGNMDPLARDGVRQFGDKAAVTLVLPNGHAHDLSYAQIDALSDDFAIPSEVVHPEPALAVLPDPSAANIHLGGEAIFAKGLAGSPGLGEK